MRECRERLAGGERLCRGLGRLEFERTKAIVERYLPPAPAVVIDVGGGAGAYSLWLARRGYQAHLVELSPSLIGRAIRASQGQADAQLAGFAIGDARCLGFANRCADAVLMLGPLCCSAERDDRLGALREAHRTLRHNGVIFAGAMSRRASIIGDALAGSDGGPAAFLHLPSELIEEVEEAGFAVTRLLPVEGVGALVAGFEDIWEDPDRRKRLLEMVAAAEDDVSVLGASPHIICVARKND